MDKDTTFRDWLAIVPFTDFRMQQYPRPSFVGRTAVPETLNDLTIGQLIELSTIGEDNGELYRIPEIILGMKPETTARMRAVEVVQFIGWVLSEVERINKLFEAAGGKPTEAESVQAWNGSHSACSGCWTGTPSAWATKTTTRYWVSAGCAFTSV